eukprot:8355335-Pyramimonas_sp.AAC.1
MASQNQFSNMPTLALLRILESEIGGESDVKRTPQYWEIDFGFGFVSCVPCTRAVEAKLRGRARRNPPVAGPRLDQI